MKNPSTRNRRGFALVVTVSMMVLLTIVVVATLSLSTVTLRAVDRDTARSVAQANARLALMMALGKLQEHAGPDQRVTATADLEEGNDANPNWTGVWNTEPGKNSESTVWLVSGSNADPNKPLEDSNSVVLGSIPASDDKRKELRAETVGVNGVRMKGNFAWWIGDEGVKARVDIKGEDEDETENLNLARKLSQSQSALEPSLSKLGGNEGSMWAKLETGTIADAADKSGLVSMGTVALALEDSPNLKREEAPSHYLHDLTAGGFGLPVNVRDGGLKADLSLVFDRSQEKKGYFKDLFGASPSDMTKHEYTIDDFSSITDAKKFFLSPSLAVSKPVGPNWGILASYAKQWRQVNGNQVPVIDVNPAADAPTRDPSFPPYAQFGTEEFKRDRQHMSSSLVPILSKLQIGFSIRAVAAEPEKAKIQLLMKPLIGMWNPHNVTLKARRYEIDWGLYPYFRFGSGKAAGDANGGQVWSMWLRDRWRMRDQVESGNTTMTAKYMILKTPSVDFQPGEFRLFSVSGEPALGLENELKVGWNENGAYVTDMYSDTGTSGSVGDVVGSVVKRPLDHRVWVGDFFLEDTQHPDTITRYGARIKESDPGSWFTFKSYGIEPQQCLTRSPSLWTGGSKYKDAKLPVPEQIKSGWDGGTSTTKPSPTVRSLLSTPQDIGTWAFVTRLPGEMKEAGQGLRGWVDANPRALVTNPRWDGSGIDTSSKKRTGWHFPAQIMGGAHGMPESARVGDKLGGNRGLISEHGQPPPEPQTGSNTDRYQGLGGATDKASGGQDHVILFDVPRSPLVSLGQFQHAQLSRYNFEPGFVVGNSYANPRIPLDQVIANNFGGIQDLRVADISYEVNEKLWDEYYFSTMGLDYLGITGNSLKSSYPRTTRLANPRMVYQPLPGDTDVDQVLADAGSDAPRAISARITTEGAFNVNSTSVTAWKAVLSSMAASRLPVVDVESGAIKTEWERNGGIRFNRFGHPATNQSYKKGDDAKDEGFWRGWRELSAEELDGLAKEIVKEVRLRGPFRSMAEFVNRNPKGSPDQQRKGPLQAAIDKAINVSLPTGEGGVGYVASQPIGSQYSEAISGENQAVGNPGYLMQGDILQSLAPILQVRSDYFRIRTYGDARDANGKVLAKAWCEAFVQRMPEYIDGTDKPEATERDGHTLSAVNRTFGRRFAIVSFRWLAPTEI